MTAQILLVFENWCFNHFFFFFLVFEKLRFMIFSFFFSRKLRYKKINRTSVFQPLSELLRVHSGIANLAEV